MQRHPHHQRRISLLTNRYTFVDQSMAPASVTDKSVISPAACTGQQNANEKFGVISTFNSHPSLLMGCGHRTAREGPPRKRSRLGSRNAGWWVWLAPCSRGCRLHSLYPMGEPSRRLLCPRRRHFSAICGVSNPHTFWMWCRYNSIPITLVGRGLPDYLSLLLKPHPLHGL